MTAEAMSGTRLVDQFESGLEAPICLTWDSHVRLNLACIHCLSTVRGAANPAS